MTAITVSPPSIGQEAYFSFKEPVAKFVRNKLNTNEVSVKFTVTSVMSMREMIEVELRDPFMEIYGLLGLSDYEYRTDVLNSVPVYTLRTTTIAGVNSYIRVPLNYISEFGAVSDVLYTNRVIVLDLGKLPQDLVIDQCFPDLVDALTTRLGVAPSVKEVSLGSPEKISRDAYSIRESVRTNSITVKKTNATQLAELSIRYSQLVNRISDLGIVLG